jgi:hypothetical protein
MYFFINPELRIMLLACTTTQKIGIIHLNLCFAQN